MVTITIDGKQISVDENLSILEAAQEADVKIQYMNFPICSFKKRKTRK